jgi:hypothetical protein
METIVLFSRCELVHLYGRIGPHLARDMNVIHVAFSTVEAAILSCVYGISSVINFSDDTSEIYKSENLDLNLCTKIDELIIEHSSNRFNLNGSIQYDRTFEYQNYDDALVLCQVYYKFWRNLLKVKQVDYLIHEPVSLFLNQIAALMCNECGAKYISQILVYGNKDFNFAVVSGERGEFYQLKQNNNDFNLSSHELNKVIKYLEAFRADFNTFVDAYTKDRSLVSVLRESAKAAIKSISARVKLSLRKFDVIDHLEYFHLKGTKFFPVLHKAWSQYIFLKYDEYDEALKYYYYPMHLEPEAVVLYWGDGIYKDQVKLIENIAAQLPPDCYLLVKDHPHAGAYRSMADYKKIQAVPNVKLIGPKVPGKKIIYNSLGVITINGTSGFEALLLNKQVYMFGNAFYESSTRVKKITNIRELRGAIYDNYMTSYTDDNDLYQFVHNYLRATHVGFTGYFLDYVKRLGVDENENAKDVSEGLRNFFDSMGRK